MAEKPKILVVDDEEDICEIVKFTLDKASYNTDIALSAEEAMKKQLTRFQLIVMDVMMPGISGFELAKRIKANPDTQHIPIIFLTAKDNEDDMLNGFRLGADDYVAKPFSVKELLARVKAVLGRTTITERRVPNQLRHENLIIDGDEKTVKIEERDLAFTHTEFLLLWHLLLNRGKVLSRQQLMEAVWGNEVIVTERTVDVNITRMRKKMGPYSKFICSRQGFGYYFE